MRLTTDRLVLRGFEEQDWRAVYEWDSDPEVVRYLTYDCEHTEEAAFRRVQEQISHSNAEPRQEYRFVMALKESDQAIGELYLHMSNNRLNAWAAYRTHPHYRGQGYTTEAVRRLLQFGFEELKLHRVKMTVDPQNVASLRVLQKVGMRFEGLCRDESWVDGTWRTEVHFAMLDHEWRTQRSAPSPSDPPTDTGWDQIVQEQSRRRKMARPPATIPVETPVLLTTKRLVLREFEEQDWRVFHEIASAPARIEVIGPRPERGMSEEAAREYVHRKAIQASEKPRKQYALVIVSRADHQVIGEIGLRNGWIAYQIRAEYRRQGCMTEALQAVLQFGFEELKLHRVAADIRPEETAAIEVLEGVGMQREACFRDVQLLDGKWHSLLAYAMLDEDWRTEGGAGVAQPV